MLTPITPFFSCYLGVRAEKYGGIMPLPRSCLLLWGWWDGVKRGIEGILSKYHQVRH